MLKKSLSDFLISLENPISIVPIFKRSGLKFVLRGNLLIFPFYKSTFKSSLSFCTYLLLQQIFLIYIPTIFTFMPLKAVCPAIGSMEFAEVTKLMGL